MQSLTEDTPHILLVDDDERIRELLCRYLRKENMRVTTAQDAAAARHNLEGLHFDLLILDVMMPGESGLDLARDLKTKMEVPIIMLTAKAEAENRIEGLEIGVDDYVPKPFEPRELMLRIQNILKRRAQKVTQKEIHMGQYTFHIERGELQKDNASIKLTERERDLMRLFANRAGTPIPRHELASEEAGGNERAVDVQINRLRRKIETDPANPVYLQTVRGKGYILHTD
ncbi:MAG: response regulator transcription factor [Rhizobiales bacterium]|nr:response regulator transcription factor [Hyphomicrobiales bacterium]